MKKKPVSMKIVFVPKGPTFSTIQKEFNLQDYRLKTILGIWQKQEGDFDIKIYINDLHVEDAIVGESNPEKIKNLKTFLKNYWRTGPILLKSERFFWMDTR